MKLIKELVHSETGKDTLVVFLGTMINILAGGLFFIFVPRILGPENYGKFSIIASTGLFATIIANFAIDSGILRFANQKSNLSNHYLSLSLFEISYTKVSAPRCTKPE